MREEENRKKNAGLAAKIERETREAAGTIVICGDICN